MKWVALAFVGTMGVVAASALYLASQAPYRAELKIPTPGSITCGAGYYNEPYLWVAVVAVALALIGLFVAMDYIRSVKRAK